MSADMTPAISVRNLSVRYRETEALNGVGFDLPEHALAAIIGPNGAGKSTLLKAMLGFIPAVSGEVRFFGQPLAAARREIAYVPQRAEIDWDFPIDVLQTVLLGRLAHLPFWRRPGKAERKLALDALEAVGMQAFVDRPIRALSGGQQQRVFLARALVQEARLYLFDEPFAGVDATTEQAIAQVFRQLRDEGATVVSVHHDLSTVDEYFDHAILLKRELIACGPLAQAFTPASIQRAYGGRLAALHGMAEGHG
ncbi:MAG: metal ABC transporter ATP-binding protein [Halothiobacillaceae bacterium]|nr:MAG: metal ABC transporter ATP-binding protein [Halothiobacillaceae bacterium]